MYTFSKDEMYLLDENNEKIAYILYPDYQKNLKVIRKVFVDNKLRGQGMASKLMDALYDHFKKNNIKTIATCPYAVSWFEKYPEKKDIFVKSDEGVGCAI